MGLCKNQFQRLADENGVFMKEKIKIRVLGDLSLLPDDVRQSLNKTEEMTQNNDQATLNVCICYNGVDELDHALESEPTDISQFESKLHGGYNVKPNILVRTSGEIRLSNFLLHQTRESHFAFVDSLWPDFSLWDFLKVIFEYQSVADLP